MNLKMLVKRIIRRNSEPAYPTCRIMSNVRIAANCDLNNSIFYDYVNIAHDASCLNCSIGDRTSVGRYSKLRDCDIGKFCSISWDVTIGAVSHPMTKLSTHAFTYRQQFGLVSKDENIAQQRTKIGNDVWIGCNSVIIAGVTVGDGAIIGAGAVVTKDVPPYSIAVGVPAKVIKDRFDKVISKTLLDIKWWDWDDQIIKDNIDLFKQDIDISVIEGCKKIKRNEEQ